MIRIPRLPLLIAIAALWCAVAHADSVQPPRASCSSATAAAAASVSCGPSAAGSPQLVHLTAFTVICGPASGTTTAANVTISGLSGSGTPNYAILESQTLVSFASEDFSYPVAASFGSGITVSFPAVTNGGACSCIACYVTY